MCLCDKYDYMRYIQYYYYIFIICNVSIQITNHPELNIKSFNEVILYSIMNMLLFKAIL